MRHGWTKLMGRMSRSGEWIVMKWTKPWIGVQESRLRNCCSHLWPSKNIEIQTRGIEQARCHHFFIRSWPRSHTNCSVTNAQLHGWDSEGFYEQDLYTCMYTCTPEGNRHESPWFDTVIKLSRHQVEEVGFVCASTGPLPNSVGVYTPPGTTCTLEGGYKTPRCPSHEVGHC